ncbi:winged helix-turn-helix transcriptional regulator [Nonomuraea soli]|uniref:DNA-binding HxlR family transcriptional regulator n=1 Tax=Nonomuraea soli TaxID=1032476 RepID=A0A7W0HTP3_9ACTN|nr:helix-turn-helix domain-containing protein [Nonomuraea soli]MBA2895358.1 DNA-binding HxlR family transcriptional regulator [Nonomuraea soli]
MTGRRKYDDGCAVAHGLDLLGERWALLIVRELLLGPKRFTDLRAGLRGASADMLTQRLRELGDSGVVRRRRLAPPAASWVYELTAWGRELEPIVIQLGRWSSRSPALRRDAPIGADSLVLSLKALFDPEAARGYTATIALHLGEHRFRVRVDDGGLAVARDESPEADAVLETDPDTLAAALWDDGPRPSDDPTGVVARFLTLFPLPQAARA